MISKKSGKGAGKKSAGKSPALNNDAGVGGPGGAVDHEPIIITGGSTTIDFGRPEYTASGSDEVGRADIRLKGVRATHARHDNGSFDCHRLQGNEVCLVVVHCSRSQQQPRFITISGGLNQPPVMSFDHGEFQQIRVTTRRKIRGRNERKIFKLEIFRLMANGQPEAQPFHNCPLIPPNGVCRYEIDDGHP